MLDGTLEMTLTVLASIDKLKESELTLLAVEDGVIVNPSTIKINITILHGEIIPLINESEVFVKYLDNLTNIHVTYRLNYGKIPGWFVNRVIVGNITYSVNEHPHLAPGEVAELIIYLPTNASRSEPVVVVIASKGGASATYALGW